jgi:pyruvate kinase
MTPPVSTRALPRRTQLVTLSFVRRADDVTAVRTHTRLPLIAKIETPQASSRSRRSGTDRRSG